ncbi:hypothetical protein HanXRQr2_Chr01g0035241 [Helianthus annuus]|uniref:Uncharacterized protein n=1 Tax=Helianthus annuus TaxID=4232 RepID=A0A251VS20_HELAN|nr:hypothetical protein HanXRQr2_Chr01g0035241 [Helianthus annuus]
MFSKCCCKAGTRNELGEGVGYRIWFEDVINSMILSSNNLNMYKPKKILKN